MPRHGKQQTPAQKLQTDEMRRCGLALRSSPEASIIDPVDPRVVSKQRKGYVKEAKAHQQLIRNAQRREERLKEKVCSQGKVIVSLNEVGEDAEQPREGDHFSEG
jgi:hypothetical protein